MPAQTRRRCKYASRCFRKSTEHIEQFCHPEDHEWSTLGAEPESNNTNVAMYTNEQGEVKGTIEQGHGLLRFLAFASGAACLVLVVFRLINLFSLFAPVTYILDIYLGFFALTTLLFEAQLEHIEIFPPASGYQDMLIQYCPFLTLALGRGLFYVFQGTLWLSLGNLGFLEGAVALALACVGMLHILLHFGILPEHVVEKAMHVPGLAAQ